ncbi:MAG: DnaA/Hda family protein [Bacilli bacterium]|nr:DnaA/Hda family protein [Bacilli bacterium]MDD4077207.1 DnaA/Hda family protein [Bacilli bacterium]MDD4387670.1 DnaA/Hda family protein [Bacilli bacterium]
MKQSLSIIKEKLYRDENVREFCRNHQLSDEQFLNSFSKFIIQMENNRICKDCKGNRCEMDPAGMQTELIYEDDKIDLRYFKCSKYIGGNLGFIDMLHFPNIQRFYNQQLIIHDSRALAFKYMNEFKNKYKPGEFTKGIFFHGIFGTGKTFLMLKLANDLASYNIHVMVAYYPDLVRFIKSSIATSELEVIINKMKYTEILMLDDIGAENNTGFIRDEVLGPVLQFRLQSNKPVFMTSNLNFDLLRKHFMESKDQTDVIKSDRIIERIRYLMHPVELDDRNYRY